MTLKTSRRAGASILPFPTQSPTRKRQNQEAHGARRWDAIERSSRPLAERLRILRIALGYDETRMAKEISVTVRTYRKWEAGKLIRKFNLLFDFADRHDVSLAWFLSGDGSQLRRDIGNRVAILSTATPNARKRHTIVENESIKNIYAQLSPAKQAAFIAYLRVLLTDSAPNPSGAA